MLVSDRLARLVVPVRYILTPASHYICSIYSVLRILSKKYKQMSVTG